MRFSFVPFVELTLRGAPTLVISNAFQHSDTMIGVGCLSVSRQRKTDYRKI